MHPLDKALKSFSEDKQYTYQRAALTQVLRWFGYPAGKIKTMLPAQPGRFFLLEECPYWNQFNLRTLRTDHNWIDMLSTGEHPVGKLVDEETIVVFKWVPEKFMVAFPPSISEKEFTHPCICTERYLVMTFKNFLKEFYSDDFNAYGSA